MFVLPAGFEVDGQQCYQPNRILVLVLEELSEDLIQAPVTGLLQENVIDMVGPTSNLLTTTYLHK